MVWQKYLLSNAPRYTSFPSALFFDDRVNGDVLSGALAQIAPYEPVSLYLHVPFCQQLCWYCGCNMSVENNYDRAAHYTQTLIREIELAARHLEGRGEVVSIHFGGGTPNFLSREDLGKIFDAVELNLGLTDKTHIAMEVDPRYCPPGLIRSLAAFGVNRFSIGVQDFDIRVQAAINRIQPYELIEECVAEMRASGIDDISFDLLYGLPHQSTKVFASTLEKAESLSPDRISLFGYAHLPARLKHQRLIRDEDLPDRDARYALSQQADSYLVEHGYCRVGFDHFAKPDNPLAYAAMTGNLRRNFQGFTDDIAENVIGLGVSAISLVKGVYAQNAKRTDQYTRLIEAGELAVEKGWVRSAEDETCGRIISDLLCFRSTNLNDYYPVAEATSPSKLAGIRARLSPYIEDGIAVWEDGKIIIPEQARAFSRVVAAAFDPYIETTQKSLTQAV
ncbi:oxygen-independent coproporphyrinogen III oxidase [Parvularcula sp. IMCC14364]|uniref:oxygen-independent coproporphyrinogen III oxidase n=1 Tax=Parvularcula sp. IMCC14364 TaxID=3067902 RepID=UPI002741E8F5|nr:oxygen-independent coproporphyrinogen III oxidase [Parvularcula sp. IMCC14364]